MNPISLLVPDDSPLRNPPQNLDSRQKVAFDGIRYALDMGFLSYQRLQAELHEIGLAQQAGQKYSGYSTQAFADAWSIVDTLWRLNLLLRHMPGLKHTPGMEVRLRALNTVEEFRHDFQHLNDRFAKAVATKTPLWGTLSWFWTPDDPTCGGIALSLVSGSLRDGEQRLLNPLGRAFETPVGLVMLTSFGRDLDLSSLVARLPRIARALDLAARKALGTQPPGGADFLIGVEFAFDDEWIS